MSTKTDYREHRERLERELAARDATATVLTRAAIREVRQSIAIARQLSKLDAPRRIRA